MTTDMPSELDAALTAVLTAHAAINEAINSRNHDKITAAQKHYDAVHKEYQRVIDRLMKGDDDGR